MKESENGDTAACREGKALLGDGLTTVEDARTLVSRADDWWTAWKQFFF